MAPPKDKRKIFLGLHEINKETVRIMVRKRYLSEVATRGLISKILTGKATKNITRYLMLLLKFVNM
jgi:hypothetical protein